ncbi:tRNA (adenine(22)-N(1))-methyltransferase [Konateibacter massiliensis]|uniref:tRNA (adenine(22)-N(1))-methyltransferase n=1 Tax=Konateibacter massiliensis TaxID=2002841 RepID=UPI000C158683|nr:class I SAM-dependent methyltransferase [Konateibacter massiliensis]
MQLSNRLSAVADMVSRGNRLVDVGTDHGYLPIYLIKTEKIPSAIAMDINKGPIERAKEHIAEHKLESYITTRLSDGVTALQEGEGDTLVIAGMGGGLVIKIITDGEKKLEDFRELILQPQSEIELVRRFLIDRGYAIVEENMILEDDKFYPMMKVIKEKTPSYEKTVFYKYGKKLLENKNPVLKIFLEKEFVTYTNIFETLASHPKQKEGLRLAEVEKELEYIKEALTYYEV